MRAHIERNILKVLEGDCETAIGAHSIIEGDKITVEAELFSLDGSQIFYEKNLVILICLKKLEQKLVTL